MQIQTTTSFHAQTGIDLPSGKTFDAPLFAAKRWIALGAAVEIREAPEKKQIETPTRKKREKAVR